MNLCRVHSTEEREREREKRLFMELYRHSRKRGSVTIPRQPRDGGMRRIITRSYSPRGVFQIRREATGDV